MNVRFANNNDARGISEVYYEWSKFRGILPEELIAPESEEEIFRDISSTNRRYIIAEIDNKIAGVCYIELPFISLGTIRFGNMMVKENHRRKGIASALINKIKDFAKEQNIKKIWLWTQEELTDAIKCYEKHGFVYEGRQKSQFCGKDALLYGLIL